MGIDDDLLLKMTNGNVYKETAKRAESACKFYAAEESDTHKLNMLVFT